MTIEYILLLVIGGVVMMSALMTAPKQGFERGGVQLASRVETSLATGSGFQPYKSENQNEGRIPWVEKEQ